MDQDISPTKTQDKTDLHMTPTPPPNNPPPPPLPSPPPPAYKECMKNHAANIGGHAVDGCGEYMPAPPSSSVTLTCAACGCHRNFHRRESPAAAITPPFLDFRRPRHPTEPVTPIVENPLCRKRFRSRFSQEQKEKMQSISEKIGWKMHKSDAAATAEFCREVGVGRGVLKVWMHNNKNTIGKREVGGGGGGDEETRKSDDGDGDGDGDGGGLHFHNSNNGSCSSSH